MTSFKFLFDIFIIISYVEQDEYPIQNHEKKSAT